MLFELWKICLSRCRGLAPPVILAATHEAALNYVSLADLKKHALDAS